MHRVEVENRVGVVEDGNLGQVVGRVDREGVLAQHRHCSSFVSGRVRIAPELGAVEAVRAVVELEKNIRN